MTDTITILSNQDLTTLARNYEVEAAADDPADDLTGRYQYVIPRQEFRDAYKNWNHDQSPLLTLHDTLSNTDIFLGKPSAERIHEAIQKKQANVQLW